MSTPSPPPPSKHTPQEPQRTVSPAHPSSDLANFDTETHRALQGLWLLPGPYSGTGKPRVHLAPLGSPTPPGSAPQDSRTSCKCSDDLNPEGARVKCYSGFSRPLPFHTLPACNLLTLLNSPPPSEPATKRAFCGAPGHQTKRLDISTQE